jgi:O-antigen/teichoic acid export membrane protein
VFAEVNTNKYLALAGTGLSVMLARLGSLSLFVYAARQLSTGDYASFVYATSMAQIFVQLGSVGWLNLIRREASRFSMRESSYVRGFVLRSIQIPFFIWGILFIICSGLLLHGSFSDALKEPLFYCLMLTTPLLLASILREYLAGFGRPAMSVLTSEAIPFVLALAAFVYFGIGTAKEAVVYMLICQLIGFSVQLFLLLPRFIQYLKPFITVYDTKKWAKTAGFTVVGYGGKLLMDRMDILLIAPLAGMEQLAIFNSTSRISAVMLMVPLVLIQFFSPRIGRFFGRQDVAGLRAEIVLQLKLTSIALFPIVAFMIMYSDQVMGWVFGAKYIEGADILWLSVLANVMFAYALPYSSLLIMTNGERPYAISSLVGLLIYVLTGLILIPISGIHGASVAMVVATFAMSIGLIWTASKRLK